jgi:putative PIN family toxin of toxin-antitoxin system
MRLCLYQGLCKNTATPHKNTLVRKVVEAGIEGTYTIILPQDVVTELTKKIAEKPYLAENISTKQMRELVAVLGIVAQVIPTITDEIPEISRDKKDDYLLAYAAVGEADYILTGDEDLLILQKVGHVKIVGVVEFYQLLKKI